MTVDTFKKLFRESIYFSSEMKELKKDYLEELAEFDNINYDEAEYITNICTEILEILWYNEKNKEIYNDKCFKYDNFLWYSNSEGYFIFTLKFLKKSNFNGKIIDFGAGNGDLSIALHNFGYDSYYYNIPCDSTEYVKWRVKKHNCNLRFIDNLQGKKFDVICAFDVSEHFENIDEFVDIIDEHLELEGIFIETSSFSIRSTGHFDLYHTKKYGDVLSKTANRIFHKLLRERNFIMIDHGWNSRPCVWQKK